jgi:hypothetical protein
VLQQPDVNGRGWLPDRPAKGMCVLFAVLPPKNGTSTSAMAGFAQGFAIAKLHFRPTMLSNLHGYGKNSEPSGMTPEQQARQQIDAQLTASVIAQEITDDLEAALEQFSTITEDLKK